MIIPPIPTGRVTFADNQWIAVRIAYAHLKELMSLGWRNATKKAMYCGAPIASISKCEVCDEPVPEGKHMTRGYLKWIHADCRDATREFVRIIDEQYPSIPHKTIEMSADESELFG